MNRFEINRIEIHWWKIREIVFHRSRIRGNCLRQWCNRKTRTPDGPLSDECIARKLVSLKESPWNLIWLMKSPWKLTSTIRKPNEPLSAMDNLRSFLSKIENQGKSISVIENHCSIFLGKNVHQKTCVVCSSSKVASVDKKCMEVKWASTKSSLDWLQEYINHFSLVGIPPKTILFLENICKVVSWTKTALKLIYLKAQHNDFTFGDRNATLTDSKEVDLW